MIKRGRRYRGKVRDEKGNVQLCVYSPPPTLQDAGEQGMYNGDGGGGGDADDCQANTHSSQTI